MRYSLGSLLAAASIGSMLSSVAGSAGALSCEAPGVMAPAWEATDVPTNTLIWCTRWNDTSAFELRVTDAQGEAVGGTQTLLTSGQYGVAVFRPDAELEPQARYGFQCENYEGAQPASFTTGAGPRNDPPALPSLDGMQVRAQADSGWGESLVAWFQNISPQNTIVVLDLEGGPALDTTTLTGSLEDARLINVPEGSAFVGKAPCVGNWPGAQLGASTRLRFGAFDLTGAFSGWTDWKTVTLPDRFEGENQEPVTPTPSPGPAPDDQPGNDGELEHALTGNGSPINEVVSADLASDNAATPSAQSSGCQLSARSGGSWAVGLLAALACVGLRRRRTAARRVAENAAS